MPKTLLLTTFCVLLIASSMTAQAQEHGSHEDAASAILERERTALNQWSGGNPAGFATVAADDITYFDDIGAMNRIEGKPAVEAYLKSLEGKVPPHSYELINPSVQVYGDVGILTLQYQGTLPDGTMAPLWKATSVYRMIDGEWMMTHANWSLVKEAPSAPE